MSLESEALPFRSPTSPPSFSDYSLALERVQRRAALRRAVMNAGIGGSFEMTMGEAQDGRDREVLDVWERHHGPGWMGY